MHNIQKNIMISIIIPVYNLGYYIERCIESIKKSNISDYEILLIDDGSTDNTGYICDSIAKEDKRIRVFHKSNGGVSSARNLGIDNANGEWLAFIDGDDFISPDFLTIPEKYLDCDIIQKGLIYRNINSENNDYVDNLCYSYEGLIEGSNKINRFFIQRGNLEFANKIVKKSIIGSDRFNENVSIGEDGLFFFTIACKISKYGFSKVGEYIYESRNSSASNSIELRNRINTWFKLCDEAKKSSLKTHNKKLFDNYMADKYIPSIWGNKNYLSADQINHYKQILKSINLTNLSYLSFKHFIKFIKIYLSSINFLYRKTNN